MPSARQSTSVPVCSSAFEVVELPPSPTQNAEELVAALVDVQLAVG